MSVIHAALRKSRHKKAAPGASEVAASHSRGNGEDEAGPAVGPDISQDQVQSYLRAAADHRGHRRLGPFKLLGLTLLGSAAGTGLALTQTNAPLPQPRDVRAWLAPVAEVVRDQTGVVLAIAPRPDPPAIDFRALDRPEPRPLPDHVRRVLARPGDSEASKSAGVAGAVRSALADQGQAGAEVADARVVQSPAIALNVAGKTTVTPAQPSARLVETIEAMASDGPPDGGTPSSGTGEAADTTATRGDDRNADAIQVTVTDGEASGRNAGDRDTDGPGTSSDAREPTRLVPDGTMTLPGKQDGSSDRNTSPDRSAGESLSADRAKDTVPDEAGAGEPRSGEPTVSTTRRIDAPTITATHRQAARALRTGAPGEAARLFRRVLGESPNRPDALLGLALAQQRMGDTAEARTTYRKLLKVEPGNQRALRNLINLAGLGPPEQALKRLERVREAHPNVARVHARIARTHLRAGKAAAAAQAMQRAVALAPSSVRYRYDLAVLHDRAGNRQRAANAYRRVLQAGASALQDAGVAASAVRRRLRYLSR
ncbi:Tfp pilus assembly protein PilF [Limimonas halophila]|uniref:Tfp pilus assembly protein PilF n=1 Tax=Limimonas halophila TaxID=1082479 RepID=A0A1G7NNU2_9PROT|nr:tetratricopeptide repeat protein [Limimonas halophila]SDF75611.1 Tfp pilus assembly protein PilF [Limimonas halophila]